MKRKACAVLALFGLYAAAAAAEDVYKCVGGDGRLSYQARPCAQGQGQSTVTIRKAPPPPAPPPSRSGRIPETAASPVDRSTQSAPPAAAPPPPPKSYKCTADNGAVFYRHSPCPDVITLFSGRAGEIAYVTNVKGVEISRKEACAQIYKVTASAREGSSEDDRVSSYDKNLGRDAKCKGY